MTEAPLQTYLQELDEHDAGFGDSGVISIHSRSRVGDTPLHWAAINGLGEIAKLMIAAGADVNALGESHYTPLDYARLHKHEAQPLQNPPAFLLVSPCRMLITITSSPQHSKQPCSDVSKI